jgi:hypothetical protein
MTEYVRWLRDLRMDDVPIVGGKNASLGEMIHHLAEVGVRVPGGFATTADATASSWPRTDWTSASRPCSMIWTWTTSRSRSPPPPEELGPKPPSMTITQLGSRQSLLRSTFCGCLEQDVKG